MKNKHKLIVRILALIGIIILVGLAVLSLVAALSDWEDREKIFILTIGATIVVPTVLYGIMLFSNKHDQD